MGCEGCCASGRFPGARRRKRPAVSNSSELGGGVEQPLDEFLGLFLGEAAALEEVLGPERAEEGEVGRVDGARRRRTDESGRGAGDGGGDGGAVGREGVELRAAGGSLRDAPGGGACCAEAYDEGGTRPQVVGVGSPSSVSEVKAAVMAVQWLRIEPRKAS